MQHALPIAPPGEPPGQPWSPTAGVLILPGFAESGAMLAYVDAVAALAPFRRMTTPGGHRMSAEMTNCGTLGWVSDRQGYRYTTHDPESGRAWPAMPDGLSAMARRAAALAGFEDFAPDACLINRYAPGARMGLHQDRDEADFLQPVVTISTGLTGIFQLAGAQRSGPSTDIPLASGDALVLGGAARLFYHGVRPVRDDTHFEAGRYRISLTFRRAGAIPTV